MTGLFRCDGIYLGNWVPNFQPVGVFIFSVEEVSAGLKINVVSF